MERWMNRCCPWRKAAVEEMEFLTSILGCVSLNFPLNLDFFRQLGGGLIYSYYHYTVISIPILCYSIDSVHEEVSPVHQPCPPSALSTIISVYHQSCPAVLSSPILSLQAAQCLEYLPVLHRNDQLLVHFSK